MNRKDRRELKQVEKELKGARRAAGRMIFRGGSLRERQAARNAARVAVATLAARRDELLRRKEERQ